MKRKDIIDLDFYIDGGHLKRKNDNRPVHATESLRVQYRISQQLEYLIEQLESLSVNSAASVVTENSEENQVVASTAEEVISTASSQRRITDDEVEDNPININTATKEQLIEKGVPEEKADSLIAAQPFGSQGAFKRKFKSLELDDLVSEFVWEA